MLILNSNVLYGHRPQAQRKHCNAYGDEHWINNRIIIAEIGGLPIFQQPGVNFTFMSIRPIAGSLLKILTCTPSGNFSTDVDPSCHEISLSWMARNVWSQKACGLFSSSRLVELFRNCSAHCRITRICLRASSVSDHDTVALSFIWQASSKLENVVAVLT